MLKGDQLLLPLLVPLLVSVWSMLSLSCMAIANTTASSWWLHPTLPQAAVNFCSMCCRCEDWPSRPQLWQLPHPMPNKSETPPTEDSTIGGKLLLSATFVRGTTASSQNLPPTWLTNVRRAEPESNNQATNAPSAMRPKAMLPV
jgi:hypothetical protein